VDEAKASKDKEAYKLLEKNQTYRIGVGARIDSPDAPSFFVEVLINLSDGHGEVDLPRLEKTVICLNALHTRGYLLAYDGNSVSCESKKGFQNLNDEYSAVKALMKSAFT
jgi:hypothetical protein